MRLKRCMFEFKKGLKIALCTSMVLSTAIFFSCSKDGDAPPPKKGSGSSYSVVIGENSNMPSTGKIVCEFSNSVEGFDVSKLVDGDPLTWYSVNKTAFYLIWQGDESSIINYYTLTSSKGNFKAPRGWRLLGSNDEQTWENLHEVNAKAFSKALETKSYRIDNDTEYRYYKLEILGNNGDASTEIAEWTMGFIDPEKPHSKQISESASMPTSGILTAQYSDYPFGSDISAIVDEDNSTSYITDHSKFYILWEGVEASEVLMYRLTSAPDSPEKDPKAWDLYGSDDNQTWDLLDSRQNQSFDKRNESVRYVIPDRNVGTYKYYKLDVTANNGGISTQIAEFILGSDLSHSIKVDETGTMPTAGVLTAQYSDHPAGSDIGAIIDNDNSTSYITKHRKFHILWNGSKASEAWMYVLTSAADYPSKDPKSWDFYGSDDNISWDLLDSQRDQIFSERNQTIRYQIPVDKVGSYKYYKLDVTDNKGSNSTQIAEYSLYVFPTTYDDLSARFNYVTKLPNAIMGKQFADSKVLQEASAEQKAWLEDPTKEPDAASGLAYKYEFDVNLYPYGEPIPADINQHMLNNCGVVASFAGLAYQYPRYIMDYIIEEVSPKHFVINMFDPKGKPIKVGVSNKFLTLSNFALNNRQTTGKSSVGSVANWGTILEKALMKYRKIYFNTSNLDGVMGDRALPPFLGEGDTFNGAGYKDLALSPGELERVFKVALAKGEIVTVGLVSVDGNKDIYIQDGVKIILNHAFSVFQANDASCMMAIRNPWGYWSGTKNTDGTVNVPITELLGKSINFMVIRPGKAGKGDYGPVGRRSPYIPPVY